MSKWSSSAVLPRPVTKIICSIPASSASSTAYWMSGRSTTVSISFGIALVAGRKRVPRPATGNTALRTFCIMSPKARPAGTSAGRRKVERIVLARRRFLQPFVLADRPGDRRRLEQLFGGRRARGERRLGGRAVGGHGAQRLPAAAGGEQEREGESKDASHRRRHSPAARRGSRAKSRACAGARRLLPRPHARLSLSPRHACPRRL